MALPLAGAKILAADLAAIFPQGTGAWTDYTPTLTQSGAVSKTVNLARWTQVGTQITAQGYMTMTGSGSAGSVILVGLPAPAAAVNFANGSFLLYDSSSVTPFFAGTALLNSSTTMKFLSGQSGLSQYLGATGGGFTAALATGDILSWSLQYEAVS